MTTVGRAAACRVTLLAVVLMLASSFWAGWVSGGWAASDSSDSIPIAPALAMVAVTGLLIYSSTRQVFSTRCDAQRLEGFTLDGGRLHFTADSVRRVSIMVLGMGTWIVIDDGSMRASVPLRDPFSSFARVAIVTGAARASRSAIRRLGVRSPLPTLRNPLWTVRFLAILLMPMVVGFAIGYANNNSLS